MKTYDKEWHEIHKNDSNIKEARQQASQRRYNRLKHDSSFIEARKRSMKKYRDTHKSVVLKRRYAYYKTEPGFALMDNARTRAKKHGVPYSLSITDVRPLIVDTCPVLGIPLIHGNKISSDNSPTLDRIIPAKGYVVGNVIVVSKLANQIKSNATPEQILAVGQFYKTLLDS